ncbi:hypothetical protein SAMN04488505_105237 [Chitinophaga rupis]|uniref:Uncharacterized protein n=1 Tax=Chitinophaga rupis TaxID=573321 RepID=A0A1H7ZX46_9BACT|nr:hypothetical protein [Chitinophaga rupis]SEM63050.1 hypothetical protein SAMN04488505_105237 [Chitinophaga rupis]
MRTPIPQIEAKHSRLITPSVKGASRPAVPVSFNTAPVAQTVTSPLRPVQPFHANPPVQRTISEARDWVKVNSDKSGYPNGWSDMPRAPEIRAYIKGKKQGWQELEAELDGPKRAKKTTPKKTTGATTTTGGPSAAAINWQKRKQKLDDSVDIANDKILKASGALQAFFEKLTSLPANIRVKISKLADAVGVKLDREHSRLAFFSTSLLEYTKQELSTNKRTPEIQTAIVEDQNTQGLSVHISGNNSGANLLLQQQLGKKTLEKGYTDTIRPFHIKRKAAALEENVKKRKAEDVKRLKLDNNRRLSDYKKVKKKDEFVLKDGSGQPISRKQLRKNVAKALAVSSHKETKTGPQNRQRKGARHFVKKERNTKLKNVQVRVPSNSRDIHAESAILESLKNQADQIIVAVGGTKVACTACQAYYTKLKQEALLGDNTSFAWLSESSMNQLGFDADKVTEYLLEIKSILDSRINKLRFYEGKSGTFNDDDLTHETDLDTDSEDEAAMDDVSTTTSLLDKVDEAMDLIYE